MLAALWGKVAKWIGGRSTSSVLSAVDLQAPVIYGNGKGKTWSGSEPGEPVLEDCLFIATSEELHSKVVAALASGADVNAFVHLKEAIDNSEACLNFAMTFLMGAVRLNDIDLITMLLAWPGIDVNKQNFSGFSALHFAESVGAISLLAEAGARFDARTKNGDTPLMLAICKYRPELIQSMVRYQRTTGGGAISDEEALSTAMNLNFPAGLKTLLEAGLKVTTLEPEEDTLEFLAHDRGYFECRDILRTHAAEVAVRAGLSSPVDSLVNIFADPCSTRKGMADVI